MLAQKQPFIQRVRNSSLVEWPCAEDERGLNLIPKLRTRNCGRGASYAGRSGSVSDRGLHTRENVGMSSARQVRILSTENPRFPEEGSSTQGQSGPKPRATAVGDGQQVEIPVPPESVMSDAGTRKDELSIPLVEYVQATSEVW